MVEESYRQGESVPLEEKLVEINPGLDNPFPGLRPFTVEECHLFFGREGQVDDMLVKMAKHRFVAVMGHSGSGKSSLMYCGMLPVLFGGFITQTGPHWHVIATRPGASPIDSLCNSIIEFLLANNRIDESEQTIHRAIINSVLRSGPDGLIEISRFLQEDKNENIFFLIDQFEEIFRHFDSGKEGAIDDAQLYVNLILNAVSQTKIPAYVSITMRSDFMGNCSSFTGLTDLINASNYLVPQMTREQKKMVIEGPVAVSDGKISKRLVKKLLSEIGNNQDQLPILQHALMRTWDFWITNREPGEPMDIRHYNAIGRISQALSQHANETFDELTSREKGIAEVLFKSITEKNQENKGMRRPCRLSLVAELAEASEEDVTNVVEHFRKSGRSFLMPAANVPLESNSMIELSHESLMRIWNRLDDWVEDEFESVTMYKRLSEAASMYQIGKTGLWRPPDLQLALNWQKKQKPTRAWAQRYDEAFERAIVFLDTSRITYEAELKNQEMMQKRVLRRTRITAIIFGIAFLVAIGLFVFAYLQMLQAETARLKAIEQEGIALAQTKLAKEALLLAEEKTKLANQKTLELEEAFDSLARSRDQLALSFKEIEHQRNKAEQAMIIANQQRDTARIETVRANENYQTAIENYNKFNRQYMLTVAQTLSTKSVQEDDDAELAGLLAMQGYHYHRRYDGKKYDPYIYRGLYYSLTKLSGSTYNEIKVPGVSKNRMNSLVLSSKSNTLYASGTDGRIFTGDFTKLVSTATTIQNPYPNKVIALSKDENYLVNGSDSAFVQIYNLKSPNQKPTVIKGFKGATNDIEFIPTKSSFIIASGDVGNKEFLLTEVDQLNGTKKLLTTLPYELKTISISPDGKRLAGGTWTGQVVLVDLSTNSYSILIEEKAPQRILAVKFSPDGKTLAYGTDDPENKRGLVKLYNFSTKETRQFTGHRAGVYDVEFSADGRLLASAGSDKRLQMWVLDNPEDLPIVMDNNNGFIWDIEFAKTSDYLIAACDNSEIRVWPTDPAILANQVCPKIKRNMSADEWEKYVPYEGVEYEFTCVGALIEDY